ncbi:MAG TPA: M14 family zinc carboxypeptidase [Thermoanaerobaculia bacterium]|nr:M14 family zinc carboxypeptidase [Thermoanaerobaculia bacterium]
MLPIEEILDSAARSFLQPPQPLQPLQPIGRSREGRDILGAVLGSGPRHVSLIGGCHPDEPVGPAMLRRLVGYLSSRPDDRYTWYIVPHVNPDGEARNAAWSEPGLQAGVFDLGPFLRHAVREKPGDDMEFGFPDLRPENRAVAEFLAGGAPFILHGSFHSIAFAPGPWFLIEPAWIDRTASLRNALRERVRALGYGVFDVDRGGEKGFRRIDEGFSTRPDSRSMIAWFEERGDPAAAAKFRPSSMEYVRSLGGDPFTFVSEMPLFLRPLPEGDTGRPDDPIFRAWLERVALSGDDQVRGMPIRDQMRLQLAFLDEALQAARGDES